ncbi:hypothetical protein ABB37_10113 [Leptomonas pyrrhocoris]|uniref:Uncharacterized protein n=1 Tax=Leptomonas pyrrhocoris TaxID=157538 RepID=A0A0N0DQK0_LEPPY|nr:hypothetical protein ABB37_10113 [Leptomonas pyrrhocoris]XP_015651549.1 hypothetical protein ABB37_10113 [Leptomonas pyrrhocoris]XP_015651550.1 hypothetical protein ABB37_10113 [Leptomonas pyrrhocoris]KPA73109.1 hypothetical protein ABB37_10113 [Leptomonas pyrrhocoris]KPA73110.1 hypothetical protein ABB37_10113 [Leptomonas pyrrhocoris]KPA73111.1 hypothetical protein ABB37_10113 [Leptomonas pyrrhocoris]|eukprot:XP_015651548.1 hypothetical protein ABB37_10113 [Leptomonas pyrrhocoris]
MSTYQVVRDAKKEFETSCRVYDSALLTFKGVDGMDVYNCSVPFKYKGTTHIFGRIEKREEWAASHVRLFVETGKDEFTVVPDGMTWLIEDPFVQRIKGEPVFGGTRVRKSSGRVFNYYSDFFRGGIEQNLYFASGPDNMKDIRVVELADGRIGVFSRPKTDIYSCIGFTIINELGELTQRVINEAEPLNVLHAGSWGGVNQAYLLSTGKVGCIAHYSYNGKDDKERPTAVYLNYSFVLDPNTREAELERIIGTRSCYPDFPIKADKLIDCAFSSGIVMREDGKCDLYSGLGDAGEGRITIDYPFEGCGEIVDTLSF